MATTVMYAFQLSRVSPLRLIKMPCRTLETIHTGILLRKLYFYSVLAIGNQSNLHSVNWCVRLTLKTEVNEADLRS